MGSVKGPKWKLLFWENKLAKKRYHFTGQVFDRKPCFAFSEYIDISLGYYSLFIG